MKTWKMSGEVTRHEKKDITKRVFEGIGDNKTERTVEVKIEHGIQRKLDDEDEGPKKRGKP